jgi:hypothetical protein
MTGIEKETPGAGSAEAVIINRKKFIIVVYFLSKKVRNGVCIRYVSFLGRYDRSFIINNYYQAANSLFICQNRDSSYYEVEAVDILEMQKRRVALDLACHVEG